MTQQAPPLSLPLIATLLSLITWRSHELIGFLYGPSSQLFATKQQIIQSNLLARIFSDSEQTTSWMTRIVTTAEQIYNPHYELAYQHHRMACILRDAGVIAAIFAALRAFNFFAVDDTAATISNATKKPRRLHQLVMTAVLYILPGMIGQIIFSKTIPIEILLMNRFNTNASLVEVLESLIYVGYCSLKSVLSLEGGIVSIEGVLIDLSVVAVAFAFVSFFLGVGELS